MIWREKSEEIVKKVYVSETDSPRRRGRPVVRWKDRVKKYMDEKVADTGRGIELTRRECVDMHLGDVPEGNEASDRI